MMDTATTPTTHTLLLQVSAGLDALTAAHAHLPTAHPALAGLGMLRAAEQTGQISYSYFELAHPTVLSAADIQQIEHTLQDAHPQLAEALLSRLHRALLREGASHGQTPTVHYVVEMDPETGWQDELFQWYDEEHMPGLASVPGTIRADRYLNLDHGPLSLACYDLVEESVMGCPPWLAVRASAWSDRVRPHFTNTKRTMFDKVLR